MRAQLLLLSVIACGTVAKINPLKPKKYKCIEIEEDSYHEVTHYAWRKEDEQLRSIGKMRAGPDESMMNIPIIEKSASIQKAPPSPKATSTEPSSTAPSAPPPSLPTNIPRDAHDRPLILSPQHCNQVKRYASMYGVSDVLSWVKSNCQFAQMYLPDATCDEINILVASCYKYNYL